MDTENRLKIIQNMDFIASNVCSLSRLLNLLLQESVLTQLEVESIKNQRMAYDAGTELANLICKKDNKKFTVFIGCLNESGNDAIAQRLMRNTKVKELTEFKPIWFGMTAPTTFYGRDKEMESLEKFWNNCLTKKILSIVAVTGLGGVGKTELAKNFAMWFYESVGGHCIWIEAETPQSMKESFQNLADNFKISLKDDLGKEKKLLDIVTEVYKKLFGEKVLIVVDNLENFEEEILKLLFRLSSEQPPTVLKPFVITTSRRCDAKAYFGTKCNLLDLQVLTKHSAIQFFSKSLTIDESLVNSIQELIEKLCERLQFYPLAMQQASAYITERLLFCGNVNEAITNYLTEIENQTKALLNYELPQYETMEGISKTTMITWRISVEQLRKYELASDVLNIISFLSPDHIPTRIVRKILQHSGKISNTANVEKSILLVRKYSMINYSGENLISVHRLVQEVTRIELEERGEFSSVLNGISKCMTNMLRKKEIVLNELVHAQAVSNHLIRLKEMVEDHAELLRLIFFKLHTAGNYRDALDFSTESGELLESVLGENNRWTLQMKHRKGGALKKMGDYSASLEVLQDVHKKQKDTFGEEDKDCLHTAIHLGNTYRSLKKYEDALQTFKGALEKSEEIYGKEDTLTLSLKNNIANVLSNQRMFDEALKVYGEVLEVEERVLGLEDPDTLTTMHNIATVKLDRKDYLEALKQFQEVLEIRERVLELNHPSTLRTKHNVAWVYYHLGSREESFQLAKEVHENEVQILGPRHPDTIRTKKLLNNVEALLSKSTSDSNTNRKCALL